MRIANIVHVTADDAGIPHCLDCLPNREAARRVEAGEQIGEAYPWTVDLEPGGDDFRCEVCGDVILAAPALELDDC